MQEEINVKKEMARENRTKIEILLVRLKAYPVIGQFISFPKCRSGENEANSEEIKLWYLSLELASAIITKNESEQDEIKKEILSNKIMQQPENAEFKEYLLTLEYSKKGSVDIILGYAQKIFMLD